MVSTAFDIFAIATFIITLSILLFLSLSKIEFYTLHANLSQTADDKASPKSELTIFQIAKKIWIWILAIFITYVTEMSVFPAILSLAVSSENWQWSSKYFIPVGCFLVFFMGKFLGSTLARFTTWPRNTKMSSWFLLCLALLRFGFIPIFLVCNIAPNQRAVSKVTIPTPIPITT